MEREFKPCPRCGKEIAAEASKCEYCQSNLESVISSSSALPKVSRLAIVGISLCFLGALWKFLSTITCSGDPTTFITLLSLATGFLVSLIALRRIRNSDGALLGGKLAGAGLVLNFFVFIIFLFGFGITYRAQIGRDACRANLMQMIQIFWNYSEKNDGKFPTISGIKNNFIFDSKALYPDYLRDFSIVGCPSESRFFPEKALLLRLIRYHPQSTIGQVHPDCITGDSYCYLGWMLTSDEEAKAFFDVYDNLSPEDYDKDIVVPEGKGNPIETDYEMSFLRRGNIIYRITEGGGCLFSIPNWVGSRFSPGSEIPIMWDNLSHERNRHRPLGGNVLYLDGHVEFLRLGSKFPMTETFMRMLEVRKHEPIPDCDE
jgi:prepilin-type processing-associated H-X9-DG protein